MKGIRKQQQTCNQLRRLGRQHAGLTSAIGMAAKVDTSWNNAVQNLNRAPQSFTIRTRRAGERRSVGATLAKGKIAPQDSKSSSGERFSQGRQ
jgi:hypothetical protein